MYFIALLDDFLGVSFLFDDDVFMFNCCFVVVFVGIESTAIFYVGFVTSHTSKKCCSENNDHWSFKFE